MKQKKWMLESPIYVHRKAHFCPQCNQPLTVKRVKRTVTAKSEGAKNLDFLFSGDGGFLLGNVTFSLIKVNR